MQMLYLYRYEHGRRMVQEIRGDNDDVNVKEKLKNFWKEQLAVDPWKTFDNLAEQCNYDELSAQLGVFVQELP